MSSMGRATARAPIEKTEALKAPLFRSLVEQLDGAGRRHILDLGAASTPMLALLGRSRCRVEIADLASDGGIGRMDAELPPEELASLAESLLPVHGGGDEALDIVFCWDLPNYLKPKPLAALMNAIAAFFRKLLLACWATLAAAMAALIRTRGCLFFVSGSSA